MTFVLCPQCARPAEITDRFTLPSSDGPVEHVKVVCAAGHWFTPLASDVQAVPAVPAGRAAA